MGRIDGFAWRLEEAAFFAHSYHSMTARDALDRTIRLVRDFVSDEVSDETIVAAFQSFHTAIHADRFNLSTRSGQTALVTLVSLIARMGVQIHLYIPDME